tara:strand:- start:42336 stop:43169 length:834 start_codon:yes stop_codon:yes gene_type:complete
MIFAGFPLSELLAFAIALAGAGLFAGFLAGLLGIGGGIVIVPVLYHLFTLLGVPDESLMHLAVGTSLGTIIITSLRSMRAHDKAGVLDRDLLKRWMWPVVLGALAGTALAAQVSSRELRIVFASVALLLAANMLFGKESWRLGTQLPSNGVQRVVAGLIGGLSAMMGIGGGTFGVTFLTLYGRSPREAVATSAGLGVLIGIPGAIGFILAGQGAVGLPPLSLGYVSLVGLALIAPLTTLAAPFGARMAHTISHKALMRVFAFFLIVTSVQMFWRLFA